MTDKVARIKEMIENSLGWKYMRNAELGGREIARELAQDIANLDKPQPITVRRATPKFNNSLQADALDWDERNLPQSDEKLDLLLTDQEIKDAYRSCKTNDFIKSINGFEIERALCKAQLAKVQFLLDTKEAENQKLLAEIRTYLADYRDMFVRDFEDKYRVIRSQDLIKTFDQYFKEDKK